ncbi:MAG: hydantoinase/oxoprolinase family protein [Pseudomonadota bacterium]
MSRRLGIELGANRTDFMLSQGQAGSSVALKMPAVPGEAAGTIAAGVQAVARRAGIRPEEIDSAIVALHRDPALRSETRVGLLATQGFEQLVTGADDLITPGAVRGVPERMSARGTVVTQLEEDAALRCIADLLAQDIDVLAISLLNAHRNPEHERALKALAENRDDRLPVFMSHEVAPESGEHGRTIATLIAASETSAVRRRLKLVADGLSGAQSGAAIEIVQSTGDRDIANATDASPERILTGASAATATAAAQVATAAGHPDAISLDIGSGAAHGTLIRRGQPRISNETSLGTTRIPVPCVDTRELGPGVGAVATVSISGTLGLGPAHAVPACRGGGTADPTVLDALCVLQRLPAEQMSLDVMAAERLVSVVAGRLGVGLHRAAEGIVGMFVETIAGALRLLPIEKGEHPERFALVISGGAGPLVGAEIGRTAGFSPVIVPQDAGLLSPLGCLMAGRSRQFAAPFGWTPGASNADELPAIVDRLKAMARAWFGSDAATGRVALRADIRICRDRFKTSIAVPDDNSNDPQGTLNTMTRQAAEAYKARFGFEPREQPEITTIRAIATLEDAQSLSGARTADATVETRVIDSRVQMWCEGGFETASVYQGASLKAGMNLDGPAMILHPETTTVLEPGDMAAVDRFANLIVSPGGGN